MSNELSVWTPRDLGNLVKSDLLPFGEGIAQANALARSRDPSEEIVSRNNVDQSDLVIPTLLLLQKMSKAVDQHIPGAAPGMFMLSTSQEVFTPPMRVLVVFFAKSRALFPKPDDNEHELCLSRDTIEGTRYGLCETCQLKEWGDNNAPPFCSESMNFFLLLPQGPALIRFARQARKSARNFVSQVTMAQQNFWAAPAIIGVETRVKQLRGSEALYHLPTIRWDVEDPVPPSLRSQCRATYDGLHAAFESGRLKEHGAEEEVDAGADER